MSDALLAKAFESRLKAWAAAQTPAIPVAWENVAFKPPTGRYARAHLLPNPAKHLTLEGTGRSLQGVFQVDLCMPPDTGAGGARALADSLDAAFSLVMEQDGLRIWLLTPMSAAPGMHKDERYVVPVSGIYKAFATS